METDRKRPDWRVRPAHGGNGPRAAFTGPMEAIEFCKENPDELLVIESWMRPTAAPKHCKTCKCHPVRIERGWTLICAMKNGQEVEVRGKS